MAFAVIQTKVATSGASSVASLGAAMASNLTAGNFVIVVADINWGGGVPATTIADTLGNTWINLMEVDPDVSDTIVWYCWNCKGGATTVTVTSTVGSVNMALLIREYSGVQNTSNPLDQTTNSSGNSTAISSGATPLATTNANDVVIGIGTSEIPAATFTLGSGYGNLSVENDGTLPHEAIAIEDQVVGTTGVQTATFTVSSGPWVGVVAAFKLTRTGEPGNIGRYINVGSGMSRSEVAN